MQTANKSATKKTLNMLVTYIEQIMEATINAAVIYLASLEPLRTKSNEIVEEIAFSNVSTLEVTKRVQRQISIKDIGRLRSSWSIKLKLGFSKPFPAPTDPPNPRTKIVIKHPSPAKIEAFCRLFVLSEEKVRCQ